MKILMLTDLEGVAGVASAPSQTRPEGPYYEASKKLLTAEINTAVAAMVEEGVTDVLVIDAHGPGAITYQDLAEPARLAHGRPMPFSTVLAMVKDFDACAIVGQHAMAGTLDGNLNHTWTMSVEYYKLNGRPIGETAMFALFVGAYGKPVIYLTGDEAACREARELIPQIETTAVKKGVSRHSAISLPILAAHRLIAEGARRAIRRHREKPVPPTVWPGPYVFEKRVHGTDTADNAMGYGAERVDPYTVRYRSDDILDIIYR